MFGGGFMRMRHFLSLSCVAVPFFAAFSQSQPAPTKVHALHISEPIGLDGMLSEPAWQGPGFSDFKQRDPNQGEPPTERTEVWVAYDDAALYVAARLYDSDRKSVV